MLALTTVALLLAAAPSSADRTPAEKVTLEGRVVVTVPVAYEYEETSLGEDRSLVALRGEDGAMVVTVYGGQRPPNRWTALSTHTEELRTRLRAETPNEVRQRLLGHTVTARDLRYTVAGAPWRARLVAANKGRRTIVAVATWRDASPARETLLHAIEAIAVGR